MKYVKLFEEFNYEQHKSEGIEIVSRVILTLNNGKSSDYIIEVEGILGKHKPAESRGDTNSILYWFKPTEYPKVFSTSNFQKLEKGEDITERLERSNSDKSIELFKSAKDKSEWMGISIQEDLSFDKIIKPFGFSLIGNQNCLISYLSLKKI
jgi:hypothetical protein